MEELFTHLWHPFLLPTSPSPRFIIITVLLLQQQRVGMPHRSNFLILLPRELLGQLLELFPRHLAHIPNAVPEHRLVVPFALLALLFLLQSQHEFLQKNKN